MAYTLYELKPAFQALLRPTAGRLAGAGVTANQVTLAATMVSIAVGAAVATSAAMDLATWPFLLLPLWFLPRMALNALDGMLAREFGKASPLGAYLNELSDVVSDAALYVPFAFVEPFGPWSIGAVIFAAMVSELAGVLGPMVGASRRYDGPMGKSDRALVFGLLAICIGVFGPLPALAYWAMPLITVAIGWNVVNRVHRGAAEASRSRR